MSAPNHSQQLTLMDTRPQNCLEASLMAHAQGLPSSWQKALSSPETQRSLELLNHWLEQQRKAASLIYPKHPFKALELVAPHEVKVIILGQDPYHGPEQAQGLSFSVPDTVRCPPSLRNIFKELALEYPESAPASSHDLSHWAAQGVLLLNTSLTVEHAKAGSHAGKGWEAITDALLRHLFNYPTPKVFLLWGAHAQAKQKLMDASQPCGPILTLRSNHPSPLAATKAPIPFIGNGHFKTTNDWLQHHDQTPITWLR